MRLDPKGFASSPSVLPPSSPRLTYTFIFPSQLTLARRGLGRAVACRSLGKRQRFPQTLFSTQGKGSEASPKHYRNAESGRARKVSDKAPCPDL